jgi:hypothetical protein
MQSADYKSRLTAALQLVDATKKVTDALLLEQSNLKGQVREMTATANTRIVDVERSEQMRTEAEKLIKEARQQVLSMKCVSDY